jgi:hypothetical protein
MTKSRAFTSWRHFIRASSSGSGRDDGGSLAGKVSAIVFNSAWAKGLWLAASGSPPVYIVKNSEKFLCLPRACRPRTTPSTILGGATLTRWQTMPGRSWGAPFAREVDTLFGTPLQACACSFASACAPLIDLVASRGISPNVVRCLLIDKQLA